MQTQSVQNLSEISDEERVNFKFLSSEIARFGKMMGLKIVPYNDESLPYFSKKTMEEKKGILGNLQNIVEIYHMAHSSGANISDNRILIWYAIKKMGIRPTSDLFEIIEKEDIVEIYNSYSQIFRSLNFYRLCSYTIEELTCIHWTDLYIRDEGILANILALLQETLKEEKIKSAAKIPEHFIEEKHSAMKFKINYRMKYIAPLFGQEASPNYLVTINADFANKIVSPAPQPAEL